MGQFLGLHRYSGGWDYPHPLPGDLVHQIKEVKHCLEAWPGRAFVRTWPLRNLHSDSSQVAWAGLDVQHGILVQDWWRKDQALHINVKELRAAVFTVRSLARKGETVVLFVNNTVACSYLTKGGGRKGAFNAFLHPFLS